jgi:cytochrome b561
MWRNTASRYGLISIGLHWLVAMVVIGLFGLGLWMDSLDYYDAWYRKAPEIHKSIGVLLFMVMLGRTVWRHLSPGPAPSGAAFQQKMAHAVHLTLYVLLFILMLSGYLVSTADGRALEVFGWFSIPATLSGLENQEDIAGEVHEVLAFTLMGLVIVHALAAMKHHFINRDSTLKRMLGTGN